MLPLAFPALLAGALVSAPPSTAATLRAKDQALLDAIAPGNRRLWDQTLASGAVYVDENGAIMDRATFLRALKPLPAGNSGHIAIAEYRAYQSGDTALVVHTDSEFEDYHGQQLRAGYITTETWQRERGAWKLLLVHVYVMQKDPPAIALSVSQLQDYVGTYRAAKDLVYVISLRGGRLYGQRTGGRSSPLSVEVRDVLFVAGQPRVRILFHRDASGHVDSYIDRREGEDIVWRRI